MSWGWWLAIKAMAITCLVIISLVSYVVYNCVRQRRLQREQQQQEQERMQQQQQQELKKKQDRSQRVKDRLHLIEFHYKKNDDRKKQKNDGRTKTNGSSSSILKKSGQHEQEEEHEVDIEAQEETVGAFSTETSMTDSDSDQGDDEDVDYENCCPICFCSFEVGELISVSNNAACSHTFHRDCITQWLIKQDSCTCPTCRRSYLEEEGIPDVEKGEDDDHTHSSSTSSSGNGNEHHSITHHIDDSDEEIHVDDISV